MLTDSLLEAALESTADGLLAVDAQGRIVGYNEQFVRLWDIPAEVMALRDDGRTLACVLDRLSDPEQFLAKVRALYDSPEATSFDVIEFRDGRTFERYSRPMRVDGKPAGRVWSFRDVTARRKAEAALAVAAAKYRIVADYTYDWEFWLDPEGRFVYCSPSSERITGKPREAFLADPGLLERMVHPDDLEAFARHSREAVDTRARGECTFRVCRDDGEVRWIEHICVPVLDGDGRYLGVRGSNRDVTERREAEARLRLAERYETVGRLAGGVAHRLNNLMTVVIGYSGALQRALPKDDPARVAFEEIEKAGEHAAQIVDRLLSYSRLQLFAPKRIDLRGVVESLSGELRAAGGERAVLSVVGGDDPLPVLVDVAHLEQSIRELAANARDAMREGGGRIGIRCARREVSPGETVAEGVPIKAGEYAVLTVEDDGCGLDPAIADRVFDPFVSTRQFGRGLGLPSVYGFARQSDGYVTLASERGKGTVATIWLPLAS
jgi:PAS domain S-box-containing protein